MVWDGDCRFCGAWIRRWQALTGDQVDYQTYQQVGRRFPELTEKDYSKAVHLIQPDGKVLRAAEAVFAALAFAPRYASGLSLYRRSTAFAKITEAGYRFVARNRTFFSYLTRLFWGEPAPSTYRFSGLLFARVLGLIFLLAFLSLWAQVGGLVGDHGILPIKDYFAALSAAPNHFWNAPSLLWLSPNNTGLITVLATGSVCALLSMAGLVPAWALLGCVLAYASLRNGIPMFLDFQWDALLIETGFAALLFVPWAWWQQPFALRDPPKIGRWVLWALFFKLMVMSGLVKILTNDAGPGPDHPNAFRHLVSWLTGVPIGQNTWLDGTALQFHYFTQPIPATTSWWFAHLSPGFQAGSLWFTLFIEVVTPFAFFGPRRLRHAAALLQILLQAMLLATGNYGFFNLLALALCLPLFDDAFWPAKIQRILQRSPIRPITTPTFRSHTATWIRGSLASIIILISVIQFWETWITRTGTTPLAEQPPSVTGWVATQANTLSLAAQRLGLVNAYGLFRVMTTTRPEIIIEGSADGTHWLPYEFYWKPGDVMRPPAFTTPHMPRLDWQMWFAALELEESHGESVPFWLPRLLFNLQQNNPDVLALLSKNPFPATPPEYMRVRVFLYSFTSAAEHEKTGAWWTHPPDPELSLMTNHH
jgi:predicted DCC family thiol-disulfide oxidoreductase YuxK